MCVCVCVCVLQLENEPVCCYREGQSIYMILSHDSLFYSFFFFFTSSFYLCVCLCYVLKYPCFIYIYKNEIFAFYFFLSE